MQSAIAKSAIAFGIIWLFALSSNPAHALRCGNRIVQQEMLESQVVTLCGEPVSERHLGYVLRPVIYRRPAARSYGLHATQRVFAGFHEELVVTEMLFNFGPRKLMRLMRFEGGRLKSIKTAGYGYLEPKD